MSCTFSPQLAHHPGRLGPSPRQALVNASVCSTSAVLAIGNEVVAVSQGGGLHTSEGTILTRAPPISTADRASVGAYRAASGVGAVRHAVLVLQLFAMEEWTLIASDTSSRSAPEDTWDLLLLLSGQLGRVDLARSSG